MISAAMTATALESPSPRAAGASRWPPLLRQLRHAARPDRARVAAYIRFAQGPGGWGEYREFLANHRSWLAGLNRALADALPAVEARGPLPELENEGARVPALPLTPPKSRAQALGYLYVLEAFRLGSEVLRRSLQTPGEARRQDRSRPWDDLVHALRGVPPEDQPTVVASARDLFLAWERWLASPLANAAAPGGALAGG
jgi:heme oxygenase